MFGRDYSRDLALIQEDLRSTLLFMMRLDAKVEAILDHFEISDGEEEAED